ncbi:MAG: alkene reductase [Gammaproteobacteria bacterium]|nr:alkene reductase [Gammaproteobacteria bacterium]
MSDNNNSGIDLFSPVKLGNLTFSNRIMMAPLTRNRAGAGNVLQDMNVEYYRQRATAGLIISEASQISPQGVGYPLTPGIHTAEQVAGWRKVINAVHEKGGHIFIQLWHVGRISHPSLQPNGDVPVSCSAIKPEGDAITYEGPQPFVEPRALEIDEIKQIVDHYRVAAENAQDAGFDGIEIHAANGYLIDQFLRDGSNQRTDEYGGSLENRYRFLNEIVQAVTKVWEPSRVGVRISPENAFNSISDSDPQTTFNYVAEKLSGYGLAYLHVVEGDMLTGALNVDYRKIKDLFGGHYMANLNYTLESAQQAIASGNADSVAFGKLYIANPDLVERFKQGAELNTPDMDTFYGGDEHGYTDYPTLETASA